MKNITFQFPFASSVLKKIKYICYLISLSPQAAVKAGLKRQFFFSTLNPNNILLYSEKYRLEISN